MQNLFGFVTYPMELGLVWLVVTVGSAGIGIILFTIFVRLLLSPLTITQLRNAKNMQRVQPMVVELREKHGKDKQKLTEATMALYKEQRVNPAMGCLPTLLQFPILIGLFYALLHLGQFPNGYPGHIIWSTAKCDSHTLGNWTDWFKYCYSIKSSAGNPQQVFDLFHANFLWLSNGLGRPDPLYILPLLAGVTQWIQSRMMLTKTTDPQAQMMNTMMNFMPLMIVFFATRYASGLSLYWVTSTLIGIAIQYRITGLGLLPRPATVMALLGNKPDPKRAAPSLTRKKDIRQLPPVIPEKQQPDGQNGQNGSTDAAARPTGQEAATRPRKKANRARGGRGGGRR